MYMLLRWPSQSSAIPSTLDQMNTIGIGIIDSACDHISRPKFLAFDLLEVSRQGTFPTVTPTYY